MKHKTKWVENRPFDLNIGTMDSSSRCGAFGTGFEPQFRKKMFERFVA